MGRDDEDLQVQRDRFDTIWRRVTAIVSAVVVTILARVVSDAPWRLAIAIGLTKAGAFIFFIRLTGEPSAFMNPPSPRRPFTMPSRRSILLFGAGVVCLILAGLADGAASAVLTTAGSVAGILMVLSD